jgi:UDP-N-acetyl-D-glucosamine dehydrogenase
MRESPALDVLELLHRRGAELSYTDPYVTALDHGGLCLTSVPEERVAGSVDCVVICTDHRAFDYESMPSRFPLIVDTRNALKGARADNVFRL